MKVTTQYCHIVLQMLTFLLKMTPFLDAKGLRIHFRAPQNLSKTPTKTIRHCTLDDPAPELSQSQVEANFPAVLLAEI